MSDEQRCATCRHWMDKDRDFSFPAKGQFDAEGPWGDCKKAVFSAGYSSSPTDEVDPTSTAVAFDHEDYAAGLRTHATHGCRMWSAR